MWKFDSFDLLYDLAVKGNDRYKEGFDLLLAIVYMNQELHWSWCFMLYPSAKMLPFKLWLPPPKEEIHKTEIVQKKLRNVQNNAQGRYKKSSTAKNDLMKDQH